MLRQELIAEFERVMAKGSFQDTQDWIEEQTLSNERKNTLWLWAWSELPRDERRRLMPL